MRKTLCLLSPLIIAAYLLALRTDWFWDLQEQAIGRHPLYGEVLDLRKQGTIVWKVPKEGWAYQQGKAKLSLALNLEMMLLHPATQLPKARTQVGLRLKIDAYGLRQDGTRTKRLIKDWYFVTDEPFSKEGETLWESWAVGRLELGLGGVQVEPGEDLHIEVTVLVPDGDLSLAAPRLKLVGDYDRAAMPLRVQAVILLREGGLLLCLVLVAYLAWFAWKGVAKSSLGVRSSAGFE